MADISDILENIRDNDNAKQYVFKKAVSKSYYANTTPGQDLFIVDLYESHAPGAPTGAAAPASPLVPGQSYTVKQLQLANLYKPAFEDNKNAAKGFKLGVAGGLLALILGAGSCAMENDCTPHTYGYGRHVSTTSAKDVFKGMAVISGGIAALAAAYGLMKKK